MKADIQCTYPKVIAHYPIVQGGPEKTKPKLFLIINRMFHKTMTLFADI